MDNRTFGKLDTHDAEDIALMEKMLEKKAAASKEKDNNGSDEAITA